MTSIPRTYEELLQEIDSLKRSEFIYRKSFEGHIAVKLIIDPVTGDIFDANFAAAKFYGWPREVLRTMNIQQINTNPSEILRNDLKQAQGHEQFRFEFRHKLSDGSIRDVEVLSINITDITGKGYLHSIVYDITDRRQAEKRLIESEERLRRAEITSKCGNWELHLDSQLIIASEGAEKIYGIHGTQFTYDIIKSSRLPEYSPLIDNAIQKLIEEGTPFDVEFKIMNMETREIIDVHSVAEYNKEKRILFGAIQDITKAKLAEQEIIKNNKELEKLNSQKDKLFSIIAHDLRSPFYGLLGITEMLADPDSELSLDETKEYYGAVHKTIVNIYKLLENLLIWGQFQNGSISFEPKVLNLSAIYIQGEDSIKQSALQKGITILNEIPGDIKIYADAKMITSVVRNLLSNAVKFTRMNGKVTVRAKIGEKGMVEISVTDNGIGIPNYKIDKLFTTGERVNTRGTDDEPSTGLGLMLCKEFVEKHNGIIWAESQAEDIANGKPGSSTFYFTIPSAPIQYSANPGNSI